MLQFLGLRGVRHDLVSEQEQQFASEPTIFLAKLVIGVLDLFSVVHGPEVTPTLTRIEAQEWALFKIPWRVPWPRGLPTRPHVPAGGATGSHLPWEGSRPRGHMTHALWGHRLYGSFAGCCTHTAAGVSQPRGPLAGTFCSPDAGPGTSRDRGWSICWSSGPRTEQALGTAARPSGIGPSLLLGLGLLILHGPEPGQRPHREKCPPSPTSDSPSRESRGLGGGRTGE